MGNHFHNRLLKQFTVIPNTFLLDNRLSPEATGVFCYLAGMDVDFNLSATRIAQDFCCGVDKIEKALTELVLSGWMSREKISEDDSTRNLKRGQMLYVLEDKPRHTDPFERPKSRLSAKRKAEKAKREAEKSQTVETTDRGGQSVESTDSGNHGHTKQKSIILPSPSEKEDNTNNNAHAHVREGSLAAAFLLLYKWSEDIGTKLTEREQQQWRASIRELALSSDITIDMQAEAIRQARGRGEKFPISPNSWASIYRRWKDARPNKPQPPQPKPRML